MKYAIELEHEIEDLFLYAVNTSELYATHCRLAREKAPIDDWFLHVGKVVRGYRREIATAYLPSNANVRWEVAVRLRDYYNQHVGEQSNE